MQKPNNFQRIFELQKQEKLSENLFVTFKYCLHKTQGTVQKFLLIPYPYIFAYPLSLLETETSPLWPPQLHDVTRQGGSHRVYMPCFVRLVGAKAVWGDRDGGN